jgi:1,2-phenylacetyl-CoA epoxidase PaaB subunit
MALLFVVDFPEVVPETMAKPSDSDARDTMIRVRAVVSIWDNSETYIRLNWRQKCVGLSRTAILKLIQGPFIPRFDAIAIRDGLFPFEVVLETKKCVTSRCPNVNCLTNWIRKLWSVRSSHVEAMVLHSEHKGFNTFFMDLYQRCVSKIYLVHGCRHPDLMQVPKLCLRRRKCASRVVVQRFCLNWIRWSVWSSQAETMVLHSEK